MSCGLLDEHACAILALLTRIAWTEDLPQPFSRAMVSRMLAAGALEGLVLRDGRGIEPAWMERARALLSRVNAVCSRMQAYQEDGYELLCAGRPGWPQALHALGANAPLFLFVKGNLSLLVNRRIAVAGSRSVLHATARAAYQTGERIAREGMLLVTGGARGVDAMALKGALRAGGNAVIVPALPAAQLLAEPELRQALDAGRLVMLCDALPDEPFSAAKAITRNHTIYALSDICLVVAAREGLGGSWRGATDCLSGGWSPVYVWDGENADTAGNRALRKRGALSYSLESGLAQQFFRGRQTNMFE